MEKIGNKGQKLTVLKSRKIGNNVAVIVIQSARQFAYSSDWKLQVQANDGKTLWVALSNIKEFVEQFNN